MRYKRVEKFRKNRFRKTRKIILLSIVMPCILVLLGYIVAAVIILPAMPG